MNTEELAYYMDNCYGTNNYYKTPLLSYHYTDGVKAFAEKACAFWLLDQVNFIVNEVSDEFMSIRLSVKDEKADIIYRGDNRQDIVYKHIKYTDCPDGDWVFYYNRADNILCWCGED